MGKVYAVLGDIHANIDALDAVLEDARSQGATDYICVGDIVGYNAAPNECVEKISKLSSVCVRGNHDHYCAHNESLEDFHPMAASVVEWTRRQLSDDNIKWLRGLPYSTVYKGITLVHSTLDGPENWGYVFETVEAESHMSYQTTQLCFHGHTHVPAIFVSHGSAVEQLPPQDITFELGKKYFVNTGSVGQPRDGNPESSYCLFFPELHKFSFRHVPYDIKEAQEKIRKVGLPERLAARLAFGR